MNGKPTSPRLATQARKSRQYVARGGTKISQQQEEQKQQGRRPKQVRGPSFPSGREEEKESV